MGNCKHQFVPKDVCYVKFTDKQLDEVGKTHQEDIGVSCRGEMVIIDRNEDGNIIGVELVGEGKSCQQVVNGGKDSNEAS